MEGEDKMILKINKDRPKISVDLSLAELNTIVGALTKYYGEDEMGYDVFPYSEFHDYLKNHITHLKILSK